MSRICRPHRLRHQRRLNRSLTAWAADTAAYVCIAGLALAGCSSGESRASDRKAGALQINDDDRQEEAVPVEVVSLQTGPIEAVLRFSTNLVAEKQVQVLARAPGLITRLSVEEGDDVDLRQMLLSLENEEQHVQVKRVANDLDRAQQAFQRQQSLRERGVVSEEAFQTAQYDLKRLELLKKDAARALRYTVVRAPIAGTLTRRMINRGDTVTISQPLFEITDFDSIVAPVFVPEKDFAALRVEQSARIVTQARARTDALAPSDDARQRFTGRVARIAPLVDPTSGTIKVTIGVPRTTGLMPGMFVEVELITAVHESAVLMPKRALVYDNDVPYAFVVDGDRVRRKRVDIALENRDHIEPREGFLAGEQVVIAGQVGLKDSALVTTQATPAAGPPEDAPADAESPTTKPDAPSTAPSESTANTGSSRTDQKKP